MIVRGSHHKFRESQRLVVFWALMGVAGYLGAFTYCIRGGVFCNAQTANFVLFAMAIGRLDLKAAAYLLIPISSYFIGTVISERLRISVKTVGPLRWDTVLVGIEVIVTFALGLLPETAPYQITQVAVNFICSMQYNTFRQAEGTPMATTFCTNHVRQAGAHFDAWRRKRHKIELTRSLMHLSMIGVFVLFGIISAVLCGLVAGKAIWGASVLLAVVFADLLYADLVSERGVKI